MNPKTMKSGRDAWDRIVEVPRMMGRSGKMHGPAMVTRPARMAKRKRVIAVFAREQGASRLKEGTL